MYNSAVFDTLSVHKYDAYIVSQDFISGAPFSFGHNYYYLYYNRYLPIQYYTKQLSLLQNSNSGIKMKKLSAKNCILTYGNIFGNSKYKDVLAISSIHNATNSLLYLHGGAIWADAMDSRWLWICRGEYINYYGVCNIAEAASHSQNLTVDDIPIDYCLAQEMDERCMLQFSLPIMFVVIICNLIKLICMIYVLLKEKSPPLVTLGDAIVSFLNEPDPATSDICLADKQFFQKKAWHDVAKTLTWKSERHRWFRAASMTRWFVCNVL